MYISHENEWHCRLKNTHDGRIGCSERRPAAAVGGTLGDGLSHRFSHTPSSIQAGAEDGRAAPRIADLTARCTESSDFRVSLAPIVALQALYLVHATRLLQLIKSNTLRATLATIEPERAKKKPEYRPQRSRSIPPRFEALDPKARVFLLASLSQASSIDASFSLSPNSSRREQRSFPVNDLNDKVLKSKIGIIGQSGRVGYITSHVRGQLSIRLIGIPGGGVNCRRIETDAPSSSTRATVLIARNIVTPSMNRVYTCIYIYGI